MTLDYKILGQTYLSDNAYTASTGYGYTESAVPGAFVTTNTATAQNSTMYSTNGITWSIQALPSNGTWNSVFYAKGRFIAFPTTIATTTTAAYSLDGKTWTATTMPSSTRWNSIAYGNEIFVATPALQILPMQHTLQMVLLGQQVQYHKTAGES